MKRKPHVFLYLVVVVIFYKAIQQRLINQLIEDLN